jgi:hypothetical protein
MAAAAMTPSERGQRNAGNWVSSEYFALRTFRSDGSAVSVSIWLAEADGCLLGYTPARSWKVRRIARHPGVEVAASDFHGVPHDTWHPGQAHILRSLELIVAKRALAAKYGHRFRLFMLVTSVTRWRRYGGQAVGLKITLDDPSPR